MREREIESVRPLSETDWNDDTGCMRDDGCDERADKEIALTYENEPDKTFFTTLCSQCASEYTKEWDKAQIFGDRKL